MFMCHIVITTVSLSFDFHLVCLTLPDTELVSSELEAERWVSIKYCNQTFYLPVILTHFKAEQTLHNAITVFLCKCFGWP